MIIEKFTPVLIFAVSYKFNLFAGFRTPESVVGDGIHSIHGGDETNKDLRVVWT